MSLKFNDCHAKIRYVDSQATVGTAVVVQVNPTTIVCESNQSVSVVMYLTRQSFFYLAVFIHATVKNVHHPAYRNCEASVTCYIFKLGQLACL